MLMLFLQGAIPTPDLTQAALTAIVALTPVVTMLIVWGLKYLWAKIPASLIFVVTPILGAAVNYGLLWFDGNLASFNPIVGALLGWLAVSLREFVTTMQTKGMTGSVTASASKF